MRRLRALLTVLVGGLALTIGADAQPQPRIVNGTNTNDFPEVGMLLILASPTDESVVSLCSGTLLGCRSFVTAAHCVCPFRTDDAATCETRGLADPRELSVFLAHVGRTDVTRVAIHPDFDFTHGGDLAVVTLASPVATVEPASVNGVGRPTLGTEATIVGFGNTGGPTFNQNDFGIKRRGTVHTSLCTADVDANNHVCWEFGDVGSNTCGGDSGGPMFIDFGTGRRVAGVTSGGHSPTCLAPDTGFDTDIFVHLDWLGEALFESESGAPCPDGPRLGSDLVTTQYADGVLRRSDNAKSFPISVPENAARMVVTLNGALFSDNVGATTNEFSLFVLRAGAAVPDCVDTTLGPFDVCTIEQPAAGAWEARVTRLRGAGEFQVTTTIFLTQPPPPCAGDCDADGQVTAVEILAGVARAFATNGRDDCANFDADDSGTVTANEIVLAIRNALGECER